MFTTDDANLHQMRTQQSTGLTQELEAATTEDEEQVADEIFPLVRDVDMVARPMLKPYPINKAMLRNGEHSDLLKKISESLESSGAITETQVERPLTVIRLKASG